VSQKKSKTTVEDKLFYSFLALFLWLPLPLGSNREWALSIMEIWLLSLSIIWLFLYTQNKVNFGVVFRQSKIPLSCFLLFVCWLFIQSIPIPSTLVAELSPETFHIYQNTYQILNQPLGFISLSLNANVSYHYFLESLSYFLLFCLLLILLTTTQRIRLFASVIIISGVFQAVYGSVMTLSGIEYGFFFEKEFYRKVATGTFINRNHLAGYLEMSLAMGIGLLISTLYDNQAVTWREFFRRLLNSLLGTKIRLRIGLALMVIALVLTHSRMGNSAFFSSLTLTGILYLLIVKKIPRSVIVLFVSLLVIDLFIVGAWFGIDKVAQRLENTSASHETRDEVVRDTITMIKDYPLVGTGGGTYSISFLRYRGQDISGFYDHAHNDYLEFMAELGAIGMSLLILLVSSCLLSNLMALRQRHHRLLKGMAFSSTMGIISILIHSLVDFNLQIPANAALFVALLALGSISLHFKHLIVHN
jgi:O-antigen ligase